MYNNLIHNQTTTKKYGLKSGLKTSAQPEAEIPVWLYVTRATHIFSIGEVFNHERKPEKTI